MVHIQYDCPHCSTPRAPFSGQHWMEVKPGGQIFLVLLQCGICGEGVIARVEYPKIDDWVNLRVPDPYRYIGEVYPSDSLQAAPMHVPDNVSSYYLQGIDNLARQNWDAAGTMFRKALDTGLKKVHPDGKGVLRHRIDSLPDELGVTPAMKQWAHSIRDLGNDAAHDEDPFTEDEAQTLHSFTELFLTYVFTLPGMVAARKSDQPNA